MPLIKDADSLYRKFVDHQRWMEIDLASDLND